MNGTIDKFENHIPDAILKDNNNLKKLLDVVEGMKAIRREELYFYTRRFLYPLVSDIALLRRYVDEWNAEYTPNSTDKCLDCLYRNYWDIYSRKGTEIGLVKLLTCLFWVTEEPEITVVSYVQGKPLILFDDDRPYDMLPNEDDIVAEFLAEEGEERWCPTLLDDTWLHQKAKLIVTVKLNYVPNAEFLEFIKGVIVLYLPMASETFTIIDIKII